MATMSWGVLGDTGARTLAAIAKFDTTPIERQLTRFKSAQRVYVKAVDAVLAAEKAVEAAEDRAAEADVVLDAAVESLAKALVGEGAPRLKPFTALGEKVSPSALQKLPIDEQPAVCIKLAKTASKHPSAKVKAAAQHLRAAAQAVLAELAPIADLRGALVEATAGRLGPELEWKRAYRSLGYVIRSVRAEGGSALYGAYRDAAHKPKKRATRKATPKTGEPQRPATPPADDDCDDS